MELKGYLHPEITEELLDAIRTFPTARDVEHCGARFQVPPFDFYAPCPHCGARVKLRSFSGVGEVEDLFDAVFEWMNQPSAEEVAARRRIGLAEEK